MAGGFSKTVGWLLIIVGILGIVGGAAGLVLGNQKQEEASEGIGGSGLLQDEQDKDDAETTMIASAATAGLGILALLFGIIFVAVGGARSRRAFMKTVLEAKTAPAPAVAVPRQAPAMSPSQAATDQPPASGKRRTVLVAVTVAVVAMLLLVFGAAALLGTDTLGSLGGDGAPADTTNETPNLIKLYPVFNSDQTGDSRYILAYEPDDVGMETRSLAATTAEHVWKLFPRPTQPLLFATDATIDFHWELSFNVPTKIRFDIGAETDGATAESPSIEKDVAPGERVVFEGLIPSMQDPETLSLEITSSITVGTGAPPVLWATHLQDCYLTVKLLS